mmetsp:Transcript_8859/g.26295  ORF Transcript_8859/g.26295 Transcript_8859/m.26295 type:complete len:204 (-) Transcript_8859:597-1208(-)
MAVPLGVVCSTLRYGTLRYTRHTSTAPPPLPQCPQLVPEKIKQFNGWWIPLVVGIVSYQSIEGPERVVASGGGGATAVAIDLVAVLLCLGARPCRRSRGRRGCRYRCRRQVPYRGHLFSACLGDDVLDVVAQGFEARRIAAIAIAIAAGTGRHRLDLRGLQQQLGGLGPELPEEALGADGGGRRCQRQCRSRFQWCRCQCRRR